MKKLLTSLLSVVVMILVVPAFAQANLLTNGGFESPDVAVLTATNPTGWTMDNSGGAWTYHCDTALGYSPAGEGTQYVFFGNDDGPGGVSQTFATVTGQLYSLTFLAAAFDHTFGLDGDDISDARVTVGDLSADYTAAWTGDGTATWLLKSYEFTATSDSSTLLFRNIGYDAGPAVDDVIVTEIPEPATALVLVLGGMLTLLGRRGR